MTIESMQYDHVIRRSHNIQYLAGLDESGNGCIAGPLIAACVILPDNVDLPNIKDSKKVGTFEELRTLAGEVYESALAVSVGISTPKVVDKLGPLQADRAAMILAVDQIDIPPDMLIIDGGREHLLNANIPQINKSKGDSASLSVASASIIATYMQHQIMYNFAQNYKGYEFDRNYGYYTQQAKKQLERFGPSPIHRYSYKPIKQLIKSRKINELAREIMRFSK